MTTEKEAVSQHRKNQSIWGAEDSFVLYFFLLFFLFFFSSQIRFSVGLLNLFTGFETVNCSEVLKLNLILKFIYDYFLNSMNSR